MEYTQQGRSLWAVKAYLKGFGSVGLERQVMVENGILKFLFEKRVVHNMAAAMGKLELVGKEETLVTVNEVMLQVTDI